MTLADKLTKVTQNMLHLIDGGRKIEHNHFWDVYQQNGNRNDYKWGFCGCGWDDETYNPKYPIVCSANTLAATAIFDGALITDTKVPISIITGVADNTFVRCANLVTIRKLIVTEAVYRYMNTFSNVTKLTNITFDGTINGSLDFSHSSLLTNESVQSIIDHLKDLTGSESLTITFHSDVSNKLSDEQIETIWSKNWTI